MLKKGFTLSEVLITLVIIGIIAGLTVPVLIQHHKRVQTAAKLKKTYSAIAQAVKLAETEHGVPSYELSHMGSHSGYAYWENNIEKYLPAGERQTYECNDSSCYSLWYLNDGTGLFLQGRLTQTVLKDQIEPGVTDFKFLFLPTNKHLMNTLIKN